jgi:hypothetical protein
MAPGRPHRAKARRNKARAARGGISCQRAWGGEIGRQQRPRILVDHGHPAHLLPGPEPLLLHGVHLPDIVGALGSGPRGAGPLGPSRAVDPLRPEGPLQRPRRGGRRGGEEAQELDADPPGAPGRVPSLELAGPAEGVAVPARDGPAAGRIADGQALLAAVAEGPPEVADGGQGEAEVGSDRQQGLAVQVAADDLLAGGERDGAGHEESSGVLGGKHPEILIIARARGYNFLSDPG